MAEFEDRLHRIPYPYIKNDDGSISTHKMAQVDNYAFPTIVKMPNGKLHEFSDPMEAFQYNLSIGNVKKFSNEKKARDYAKDYKAGTVIDDPINKQRRLARLLRGE